jgi:hypothetical protein
MNHKLIWKIEELWKAFYKPAKQKKQEVFNNYNNFGISKYYSRFHKVDNFDFSSSKKPVFSDDYGSYKGLEKLQVSVSSGKLVYLFDNHNEILYPIIEIASEFPNDKLFDIVHIDAHPDDAKFQEKKSQKITLDTVKDYIPKTRISDFFDAISDSNLIGKIHRVTHSDSLEFFLPPEQPYILSLDIDIFGAEGDFAELKDKVRAIALAWNNAEAVCIATSPGFIDQDFAEEIIKTFTRYD